MSNLRIVDFDTPRSYGNMNTSPVFFDENTSKEERTAIMRQNKQKALEPLGLNYTDLFIVIQKTLKNPDKYKDGYCYTLTKEDIEKYTDLYDYDVYADMVRITPETRNIALGVPAADCAILKVYNPQTKEIILSHCGGEYIDRYLPMQTIDAISGNEKDIKVIVSPFAHSLYYEDAGNLTWANNENVWAGCKDYSGNIENISVRINIYNALKKQLLERGIKEDNISFSPYDIANCDLFYSNSKSHNDKSFAGRFLSGIALIDNDKDIKEDGIYKTYHL